ncbi:MAG: TonB-dependent receptor [Erythrobacter sp.]
MSLAKYISLRFSGRSALLAATAMMAPVAVFAQNTVTGIIVDQGGVPVPGAQVNIKETGQRVITDRQGRFFIPSLPEGEVTLDILYRGLASATETVAVRSGETNNVTITLLPGDEIVVLGGINDPTARALNQQKNADATMNIISADSIGRLPDINIAEALQRIPGFGVERDQGEGNFVSIRGAPSEFTAVTVDGVTLRSTDPGTRAIDLGTFNSDLVASIEVSKSLLPYQDADSIAGAINLTTRSAFDNPRLVANVNGGISFNELGGTNDYRMNASVSNVFGNLGVTLSGTLLQTDREVDNIENEWGLVNLPEGGQGFRVFEQLFKDYQTRRQRITLAGALELRPDNVSRYFLRANFNRRVDDEYRDQLLLILNDGALQPGSTETRATWNNARVEKEFRHRVVTDQSLVVSAGGQHDWTGASLDYLVSYTQSEQFFPNRQQLRFRSTLRPTITQDFTNPRNPDISIFSTGEHQRLERFNFRQNTFREQDTSQSELAMAANLKIPTEIFGTPSTIQVGAKARLADITTDNEQWRDRRAGSAPDLPLVGLVGQTISDNFNYNLGLRFNPGLVKDYFRQIAPVSQDDASRRVAESITSDYEAKEDIYAGYAMARMEFSRTNVIVGLRVEHTRFDGSAPEFNADTETFTIGQVTRSYTDFFPNLTIRHEFTPDLIGRFAASRAIARPNFRDVVPRVVAADDEGANLVQVARGNPDLRQTISNNLDAGIEYYFKPLGLIGFNVFYKDLENYEFTLTQLGTFNGQNARITQQQNARDGYILGAEAQVQSQFTFLPGILSNFGFFGNVAYADAKITLPDTVPGRPDRVRLPNQSDWTYNASLFFERKGFNARIAYTNRTDYIDEFGDIPDFDLIWEGRGQLDATASYDFSPNFSMFVEAKNITNTAGVRYFGDVSRIYEFEKFGAFYFVGARLNF